MTSTRLPHAGFSLVELSIVMVILGLLVGGILSGQSLIRAASLRATMRQMTDIQVAMRSFQDRYFGLPGDIMNATSFWPSASNGNGNGRIEASSACFWGPNDPDCQYFDFERPQFFMQLGLAGLTTTYDGSATLGAGYPAVKRDPSKGMMVTGAWVTSVTGSSNMQAELYTKDPIYLYLGICNPAGLNVNGGFNDCAIFLPEDTWNIDTKMDDGKPLSGKIIAESYNTTCINGTDYALDVPSAACNIMYSLK